MEGQFTFPCCLLDLLLPAMEKYFSINLRLNRLQVFWNNEFLANHICTSSKNVHRYIQGKAIVVIKSSQTLHTGASIKFNRRCWWKMSFTVRFWNFQNLLLLELVKPKSTIFEMPRNKWAPCPAKRLAFLNAMF